MTPKRPRRLARLAILALLTLSRPDLLAQQAEGGAPRVTLSLADYEKLRQAGERPSLSVVDLLRLSGSFKGRDLTVTFNGRGSGSLPTIPVLSRAEAVALYACEGDALLSRGGEGAFNLTPQAPRFSVRCRLTASGSDRIALEASPAVLWVESDVSDGELVTASAASDGSRPFSVVRMTASASQGLLPTATGRYRISLRPDETRFRYQIEVRNPNRARAPFDVVLASGERVQLVDAQAPYETDGSRLRFDLPPGDSTLTLTGTLTGSVFRTPIEAALQYLLVESHPLLRPALKGGTRRVSPEETSLQAEFRGAQAFLLGRGESLEWTVTRLEALRTTSFAIRAVHHLLYIPAEGPALGESRFDIDNQGASDITLDTTPEPTFASMRKEPVLLTKNAAGKLWLPLPHGQLDLVLQHRQEVERRMIAVARLAVPRLPAPATTASVQVRTPREWTPLYVRFGREGRLRLPPLLSILWLVLLAFLAERALALLGLELRPRVVRAIAIGFASVASTLASMLVLAALLVVFAAYVVPRFGRRPVVGPALAAFLVVVSFLIALVSVTRPRYKVATEAYSPSSSSGTLPAAPVPTPVAGSGPRGDAPPEVETYQGLPARFDIPRGDWQGDFHREMLAPDASTGVTIVLVSSILGFWLRAGVVTAAAVLLLTTRRALGQAFRDLVQGAREPDSTV